MFRLELSGNKMVNVVMMPYIPSAASVEMNEEQGAGAQAHEIQVVPTLQVFTPEGDVIVSLMMSEEDVLNLNNLLITVGKSCGATAVALSEEFSRLMSGKSRAARKSVDPFSEP